MTILSNFANIPASPATSIAAAGSASTDATTVPDSATFIEVTAADGTKGVILVSGDSGKEVVIYSSAPTNALKVYPHSGGKINEGSTDAALSITARKPCVFKQLDSTRWVALQGS